MNKWLYKNMQWLYNIVASVRMSWYINTKQIDKGEYIINEHLYWLNG